MIFPFTIRFYYKGRAAAAVSASLEDGDEYVRLSKTNNDNNNDI